MQLEILDRQAQPARLDRQDLSVLRVIQVPLVQQATLVPREQLVTPDLRGQRAPRDLKDL